MKNYELIAELLKYPAGVDIVIEIFDKKGSYISALERLDEQFLNSDNELMLIGDGEPVIYRESKRND